jgi:16S rRNA (cytosine967-C5)-methyltransferase
MAGISRRIALSVLTGLEASNVTMDVLLTQAFEKESILHQRDRALATELVFGVVRWRDRLDWILKHLSHISFPRISPPVLNILRLGLYQILFLSRIPPSAAVNDAVELAKETEPQWVAGYVNGVLRSAVRAGKDVPMPDETTNPILSLSIEQSHPAWLVERWVAFMGIEETKRRCRANNRIPPLTIRVNTLKCSVKELMDALAPLAGEIVPAQFAPEGLVVRGLKQSIGEMAPFCRGWFQVQDEAAQLVTHLLDPKPGEKILDACAGLGGKTGHIAQIMGDSGRITATDRNRTKLDALQRCLVRLGITTVTVQYLDIQSIPQSFFEAYDRVLLDAPCSGLGVIRRNPDVKWKKKPKDLVRLQQDQTRFLTTLAPFIRKGGILLYCVCSLEPEEGEDVVNRFLKRHRDFDIDDSSSHPTFLAPFVERTGFFRTSPQGHDMDGFFAVRLRKIG